MYSIVQMPLGVPVATVAINGGGNAGLLAAQIISLLDEEVKGKLIDYKEHLNKTVIEKAKRLEEIGWENY